MEKSIELIEELVMKQAEQIEALKEQLSANNRFVYVRPPTDVDNFNWYQKLSNLCTDECFVFYFAKLQYEIMAMFGCDKENSEYYRGQMAMITRIAKDSEIAADNLQAML